MKHFHTLLAAHYAGRLSELVEQNKKYTAEWNICKRAYREHLNALK